MCALISLIAAKSDYIEKASETYENLREFEEIFEVEAAVIDSFKCMLARDEEIEDFVTDGIYVAVYMSNEGYELHFLDYRMRITTYERQIIDFQTERY